MKYCLVILLIYGLLGQCIAEENFEGELTFGVVPQQEAKTIRRLWNPVMERISNEIGVRIVLKSADTIGLFQSKMLGGEFDVAYSNPLLYIIANSSIGYKAVAREQDKKLQGIIVSRREEKINVLEDLNGKEIVFPEHAFAATILTQSYLNSLDIRYQPSFVFSHDAAYKFVALGKYVASGGVLRTFNSLKPAIKSRLRVLRKFDGVTPHAFSVHPRVSEETTLKIQQALLNLSSDEEGRKLLKKLRMNRLGKAQNNDWNDVRKVMSPRK